MTDSDECIGCAAARSSTHANTRTHPDARVSIPYKPKHYIATRARTHAHTHTRIHTRFRFVVVN